MSYVPHTPAGTPLLGLASHTEEEAKRRVMIDAAHMPYKDWPAFLARGYAIKHLPDTPAQNPPIWYGSGK